MTNTTKGRPRALTFVLSTLLALLGIEGVAFAAEAEHWSLQQVLLPDALLHNIRHMFGTSLMGEEVSRTSHMFFGLFVLAIGILFGVAVNRKLKRLEKNDEFLPDKKLSLLGFFETVAEMILGTMTNLMGRDNAYRYFPLIGALAFFILFSNFLGMVPGFLPITDTLSTNLALSIIVFLFYNVVGVQKQGVAYFKHFLGPIIKWYALPLMLLMLLIEIISHLVRPLSLAIRLMGNMYGDHKVLSIFLGFGFVLVPLPIQILGVLVAIIQTVVFCLLSIVYISIAVEEHESH